MQEVVEVLNAMLKEEIITHYAVFGAVAQMRYTEAVVTLDADILIALPDEDNLDVLRPIYEFCSKHGFKTEGEAIRIGEWPVQFIPAFDSITKDALLHAEHGELDGTPFRVVSAAHLAVIALSVGRGKDFARILALRESGACSDTDIAILAEKHGLSDKWLRFLEKFNAD